MRRFSLYLPLLIALGWGLGCSQKISVGDNDKTAGAGEGPDGKGADGKGPDGTNSGDKSTSDDAKGTCFGEAKTLPDEMTDFCENFPEKNRKDFTKLLDTLCTKKKLVNLFNAQCGWDGEAPIGKYIRILENTSSEQAKTDETYYYYVAYSLTLPKSDKTFSDSTFFAHSDPEEFAKKYVLPKDTKITPSADGIKDEGGGRKSLVYDIEVTKHAGGTTKVTSYTSSLETYFVANKMNVVLDYTIDNLKGINYRRNLTLSERLPDGRGKLVIVEERELTDIAASLRDIAKRLLLDLDIDEMEIINENANR